MSVKKLKNELAKKKRLKKEFERYDLAEEIATSLLSARVHRGITQAKLGKLVGTSQPNIARAESGEHIPSISFLQKVADVLKVKLKVKINLPEFDVKKDEALLKEGKSMSLSLFGGHHTIDIPDEKTNVDAGINSNNSRKEVQTLP